MSRKYRRVIQRQAQCLLAQAQCALGIVVSSSGEPPCAIGIFDETTGVGAVEFCAGKQRIWLLRIAADHAVDQQQIRRNPITHGRRIILIEDRHR